MFIYRAYFDAYPEERKREKEEFLSSLFLGAKEKKSCTSQRTSFRVFFFPLSKPFEV